MTTEDLFESFRKTFPAIAEGTDVLHHQTWDVFEPGSEYLWFESLAKYLNATMNKELSVRTAGDVFEFMRHHYHTGGSAVRDCIDTSFVENLFWQVPGEISEKYWQRLPNVLQERYIAFHGRAPV